MPSFNRRGFLQMMSAASVAPLLPPMPVQAATANVSASKALWAGIYKKSGSVPKFLDAARNMGLSNSAIQGVGARSIGVRLAVSAATNPIARAVAAPDALPSSMSSPTKQSNALGKIKRGAERLLMEDADEVADAVAPEDENKEPIRAAIHQEDVER